MKIFGKAAEFYRVRIQKLVEEGEPSMKWDDAILYRRPAEDKANSRTLYMVQAVRIDDSRSISLGEFSEMDEADKFMQEINELLEDQTKNQFEERFADYFD